MTRQMEKGMIFSDLALARRLERTEAKSNALFVESRARLFPDSGAEWIEVAGAYAMFDGVASPITQTFGLGLFDPVGDAEMRAIEDFFKAHGSPVCHEVSPMTDPALAGQLSERGYHPIEFTSVMFRPIDRDVRLAARPSDKVKVRIVGDDEHDLWARTSARGWNEFTEYAAFIEELSVVSAKREGGLSFLAEIDGQPVAAGALNIFDGVGLMAGASTVPESRRQGAQLALLEGRLRYAAEQGCDIAMMCALPGSASQRNAERHGFRIAYTRIKWRLGQSPA